MFNVLLLLSPYWTELRYWRCAKRTYTYTPRSKILSHKDEMLLTLMRIRLGLLNEDLADRFGISPTICSNTFTTWIKVLGKIFGDALVVWLPRELIRDNLSEIFAKTGHAKCRVIIDCSEVFTERPKSLLNQASTWSDYKHHNTIKFLIGITSFLSDCYGGRSSDKFITGDSGFYDLLERDDEVMALASLKNVNNYFCQSEYQNLKLANQITMKCQHWIIGIYLRIYKKIQKNISTSHLR